MKFGYFFTKRSYQVEPTPLSLLQQFAIELDKRLANMDIQIINGPHANPCEFQREINAQDALMQKQLKTPRLELLQTDKGPLYTTTPFAELLTLRTGPCLITKIH
jgi:hypothetical protein